MENKLICRGRSIIFGVGKKNSCISRWIRPKKSIKKRPGLFGSTPRAYILHGLTWVGSTGFWAGPLKIFFF
jgi:hypothetical protein